MKTIVFVKLGGSVITDKSVPCTARPENIDALAKEFSQLWQETKEHTIYILGNGAGSFGHLPVKEYRLREGFATERQQFGYAKVHHEVMRLNHMVIEALQKYNVPATSVMMNAGVIAQSGEITLPEINPVEKMLDNGLVPCVFGDVVIDDVTGISIISTERWFEILLQNVNIRKRTKRMLFVMDKPGVLDADGNVIETITQDNVQEILKSISNNDETDVTGGVVHKINTARNFLKHNIQTVISSHVKYLQYNYTQISS